MNSLKIINLFKKINFIHVCIGLIIIYLIYLIINKFKLGLEITLNKVKFDLGTTNTQDKLRQQRFQQQLEAQQLRQQFAQLPPSQYHKPQKPPTQYYKGDPWNPDISLAYQDCPIGLAC